MLAHYLAPHRRGVALLALLLFGASGLQVLYPQILRSFIDAAVGGAAVESLEWTAALFLATAVLQQVLFIAATAVGERLAWSATNQLREQLVLHCMRLDLAFHTSRTPGELIERVDGDVALLSNFFSQFSILVVGNALFLLGVLVSMLREDWRIGAAFAVFVAIGLALQLRFQQTAVRHYEAFRGITAQFFGRLGEWLTGTEDIRSSGAVGWVLRDYEHTLPDWLRIRLSAGLWGSATGMTSIGLFGVANAVALGSGASLYLSGAISIGTVYLLYQYTEQLRQPFERIRTLIDDFQKAGAGLIRVRQLLATTSRLVDAGTEELPSGPLSVELRDVSFGYEDAAVLSDVSFCLAPGRTLGLLGHTGSGKTTIARLLVRLYDVQNGRVLLEGTPVSDVSLESLRTRVRLITQDVQLFRGSLRHNLTLFDDALSDDRVKAALVEVGLAGSFDDLDAELDPRALSAGQAQLLALARAFLAEPGLIVLDEAAARLDPATEALTRRAIDRLLERRTGIVIAHRLATIRHLDEILVLDSGRVVEHGERAALEASPSSHFARLLRTGELAELLA